MLKANPHRLVHTLGVFLLGVVLLLSSPSNLFGYTDPGTGAFIYQAVYAAFIGGAFYFRKFLNRVFRKRQ